jgi:4-carboxymuconolactone decarboxylase
MSTPRIPPLPREEWDADLRTILERPFTGMVSTPGEATLTLGENNIFSTLARHRSLFTRWMRFGGYLLGGGVLPARERELLILRTGYNCGSAYEWGQHVRLALAVGLARAEIERVAEGPEADGWSEADRTLLRAADELNRDAKISSDTWARLAGTYDERGLIEITMLVGQYHMVAFALNSLEVELDEGLEGLPET